MIREEQGPACCEDVDKILPADNRISSFALGWSSWNSLAKFAVIRHKDSNLQIYPILSLSLSLFNIRVSSVQPVT